MKRHEPQTTSGITGPAAVVLAALIGFAGLVIGAFLTPLGQRVFPPNEPEQSLPKALAPQNTQASGSADLGKAQMCWGQNPSLAIGSERHVRAFSFTFPRQFKSVPTVTYGINVVSSGYVFGVYNASITESAYTGTLVEVLGRKTDVQVSMSYTAIGEFIEKD